MGSFFNKLFAAKAVKPEAVPEAADVADEEKNKLYHYGLLIDFNKNRHQYIERITEQPPAEIDTMIMEYCEQRELSISNNELLLCRIIEEKLTQLRAAKEMVAHKSLTAENLSH